MTPFSSTVSFSGVPLGASTVHLRDLSEAASGAMVVVTVVERPIGRSIDSGSTIEVTVSSLLTVTLNEAVGGATSKLLQNSSSEWIVIVASPAATPVTRPVALSTVATFSLFEV